MNMELSKDDQLALLIAQKIVIKLARDWQKNPCYWYSEIDIQAELRSRLQTAYSLVGLDMVHWASSENSKFHSELPEEIARVQCEPQWSSGVPDVVVWGEKRGRDVPDDQCPALWACEIKYIKDTSGSDIEKLRGMLGKDIRYGCSLSFQDGEDNSPLEPCEKEESNLRIIVVRAPRQNC